MSNIRIINWPGRLVAVDNDNIGMMDIFWVDVFASLKYYTIRAMHISAAAKPTIAQFLKK